jgi:hypothetical protein
MSITNINQVGFLRRRPRLARRLAIVTAMSTVTVGGLLGSEASAGIAGEAEVTCNTAYNTIEVTPRVVSDYPNDPQWAATRVWIGRWDGSTWRWSAGEWKVESVSASNNPAGYDIARRPTQSFQVSDGHHYVFIESYRWDGRTWYGQQWQATTSYTLLTPSVSSEPNQRSTSAFCSV